MTTDRDAEPDWNEAFNALRANDGEPLDADLDHSTPAGNDVDRENLIEFRLPDYDRNEIRRGQRLLAKPHGTLSGTDGDPSEEEIKAMTTAIRAEWSERELRRRAGGNPAPVGAREARAWGTEERGGR